MWPCETGKIGTHLGKYKKNHVMLVRKKIQSKVDTSCWMFVSAFQAMKLIETAQGGGGWVLLSNCPLELMQCVGIHGEKPCGGLIMCTNLERTKRNIPRSPCSFIFEKETMTNENTFKITWELDYVSNIYFSFHFG